MDQSFDDTPPWLNLDIEVKKAAAEWVPTMQEGISARFAGIKSGKIASVATPWPILDHNVQPTIPGAITVLCGDPGSSKSFMTLQLFGHLCQMGVKVAVYELEKDKTFHGTRYLAQLSDTPSVTRIDWVREYPEHAALIADRYAAQLAALDANMYDATKDDVTYVTLLDWVKDRCEEGARVVGIDPITVADPAGPQWTADRKFMSVLQRTLRKYGASAWIVTHPKKGNQGEAGFDELSGGTAWSRFTDSIIWMKDPPKPVTVRTREDAVITCNRLLRICKARDGLISRVDIAFDFLGNNLTFREYGIVKEKLDAEEYGEDVMAF